MMLGESTKTTKLGLFFTTWPIFFLASEFCLAKIEFTSQPQDKVTGRNLPLLITCTANTTLPGTLLILWKFNSTWIVDYHSKHFKQEANGSLYFQQFLASDQGFYQCSALVQDSSKIHLGQIYSRNATIKLAYIHNKFKLDPESRSGQLGTSISLQCLTPKSEPIADIYWEKDRKLVSKYEIGFLLLKTEYTVSSTLVIKDLNASDMGSYRCRASNKLIPGKVISSAPAIVSITAKQARPYFEKRPANVVASRNQPFTWNCIIRGVPQPSVRWYQNSQLVLNDTNRFMLSTGSLHIVSVLETYNGRYTCEGSNTLGKITSNPPVAFVVAFIDYIFAKNPANTVINARQQLTLSCSPPRSYPTQVKITWYKDYKTVVTSSTVKILTDGSLQVDSVTKASEGTYFCVADNPVTKAKRTSKTAVVTVRVSSYILPTFTNTSVIIGKPLSVICTATGSPLPSVKWYRNSQLISRNGTLYFARVNTTDAGNYRCVATNPAGNATRQLHIDVFTKPNILTSPSNLTKNAGQSAEFVCEAVGYPKPRIEWYFIRKSSSTRQPVIIGTRFIQTSRSLQISTVEKIDEGRYICIANSTGGEVQASAFLTVNVPPTFTNKPQNKTTTQAATVTFHCSASGDPLPAVSWYRSGRLLKTGAKYEVLSGSLAVKSVVVADSGWLTCKVSNVAGIKNSTAYLDVQVAPSISIFAVPMKVRHGSNFTVTCGGTGNPKPAIRWRRNSTTDLVADGNHVVNSGSSLFIIGATSQDSGLYECVLTNSLGVARRDRTLVVQVLPLPPKSLAANSIQSMSLMLSWRPGFDGYSPTLSYILEISRKSVIAWTQYAANIHSSRLNYTVYGLQPFTSYLFRMQTVTGIGRSVFSSVFEAKTLESAPSIPLNVRVQNTNATAAVLTWMKPSSSHGVISLYQLKYGVIDTLVQITKDIAANQLSSYRVTVNRLRPFSRYYFQVRAATGNSGSRNWGNLSSIVYADTPEAAPSAAPKLLNVTAISSTSILVKFEKLNQLYLNGILTGYNVTLTGKDYHVIITNSTDVTFTSLKKFSLYEVRVKACNRIGCGPESQLRSQRTLEDVPSKVMNVVAVAVGSSSINITWHPPTSPNGFLLGYIVTIMNSSGSTESTSVGASARHFLKRNLTPNSTYSISVAARTKEGTGPKSTNIVVVLGPVIIKTTSGTVLSSAQSKTQSGSSSSSQPNTSPTTAATKITSAKASIGWFSKENLAITIGVIAIIALLLVAVLVLLILSCRKRIGPDAEKRGRWINTRTQSGADNPVFHEEREMKLTSRKGTSKSPEMNGPAPSRVEIPLAEKEIDLDDFVFESESENQSINPSNAYAADETIRLKGKDDKSPLVKLRNNPIDLGDDASEYDSPYTGIGELGEPFSKDLFAFIDEEEKRNQSDDKSSQDSLPVKEDFDWENSSVVSESNMENPESKSVDANGDKASRKRSKDSGASDLGQPGDTDVTDHGPPRDDLTWDPYDASKAAVHDPDEHPYDVPEIGDTVPPSPDFLYAKVDKKSKSKGGKPGKDDKVELINDAVFIYDQKTDL